MSPYYFNYPAISNSMLSEFESKVFGMYKPDLEHAYEFGSIVHQLILEPHRELLAPKKVSPTEIESIWKIYDSAMAHPQLSWFCRFSQKEVEVFWHDTGHTDLPLKSKLDAVYRDNDIVIDLKTTSCKTEKAFRQSIKRFNYLRQAAFYTDSVQGKRFLFFAIQKHEPFNVFTVELTPQELQTGRNHYRQLLDLAHRQNYFQNLNLQNR